MDFSEHSYFEFCYFFLEVSILDLYCIDLVVKLEINNLSLLFLCFYMLVFHQNENL